MMRKCRREIIPALLPPGIHGPFYPAQVVSLGIYGIAYPLLRKDRAAALAIPSTRVARKILPASYHSNMSTNPAVEAVIEQEKLFEAFENLMPFRVQDILLVSSLYDSFILREDGRLNELLIGESYELNLQHVPRITHVKTGAEALALARADSRFNLIVTNLEVEDMDAAQLAREVKNAGLRVPVIVLAYDYREITNFIARNPQTDIERIFLWQGNTRILISI